MTRSLALRLSAPLLVAACSAATRGGGTQSEGGLSPEELERARNAGPGHVEADVHFLSGMIPHHAQAVLIAGWAASHGARSDVRILCERIVVAQRDEIALMQNWLRDRGEPVPDSNATHHVMRMGGTEHRVLMPGMLTDEELAELDRARGAEWDRLFLTAMIKHHQGAITMVDELFGSPGAAQDEFVFRFAADVYADQTTEIDRMQKMLAGMSAGGRLQ